MVTEPDDGVQPGCMLWADPAAGRGGDGGRHHGHQVCKRRRRNPHPEWRAHPHHQAGHLR